MPASVTRRPSFVRFVVLGLVGFCAVMCVILPTVVGVARLLSPDGYRIDRHPGASVVVRFEDVLAVRLIGFGPGTDGDYWFFLLPFTAVFAAVPLIWFLRARRSAPTGRTDRWFRRACLVGSILGALGELVIDPVMLPACVVPVGIVVGAVWLLSLLGLAIGNRKTLAERGYERGLCPTCGYDVRATPERCPECGNRPVLSPLRRG